MNIGDTLSLVKKGYSVAEIKEISTLAETSAEIIELAKSATNYEDFTSLLEVTREPEKEQTEPTTPPADRSESEGAAPEEKKENGDYQKEIDSLRAQLQEAQKKNASADLSGGAKYDHEERLKDMMRSLY